MVIGITSQPQTMSQTVRSLFLNELTVDTPSELERLAMVEALASTIPTAKHIDMNDLAKRTAVSPWGRGYVIVDMGVWLCGCGYGGV